jgi:uncharacterized BrkB/YihY/UPF0761 family membrane protein
MALSLAPTLVILLAVASLAFGAKAAEGRLILEIQGLVGSEGAKVIQSMIEGAHRPRSGIATILLGLVPLFIGATAAVSELKAALNTIWRVPDDTTCSTVRSMFNVVIERFLSFALVLGAGLFLLLSLMVNAWISAAGRHLQSIDDTTTRSDTDRRLGGLLCRHHHSVRLHIQSSAKCSAGMGRCHRRRRLHLSSVHCW